MVPIVGSEWPDPLVDRIDFKLGNLAFSGVKNNADLLSL